MKKLLIIALILYSITSFARKDTTTYYAKSLMEWDTITDSWDQKQLSVAPFAYFVIPKRKVNSIYCYIRIEDYVFLDEYAEVLKVEDNKKQTLYGMISERLGPCILVVNKDLPISTLYYNYVNSDGEDFMRTILPLNQLF